MTRSGGPAIMGGAFTDPARARDAFDTLIDEEMHAARDLDVFFSSSNGEYRVVVAAKNRRAEA